MFRAEKILATTILFILAFSANAGTCSFSRMEINPIAPEKNDIFIGTSDFMEIRFNSEDNDSNVSYFPEPPLIIINKKQGSQCEINGGVWARNSVFISSDMKTLATREVSGSSGSLILYSTATCKKISEIDISDATLELNNSKLQILRKNRHKTITTEYTTDSKCKLKKLAH